MARFILALLALWILAAAPTLAAADEPLLKDLYKPHPRLFIRADALEAFGNSVKNDTTLKQWDDRLRERAERMLNEKPVERVLISPRLLGKSRTT